MSIGSAVFVKDSFILGEGSKSNTASVDVVSSTELLSERQLEEYDYDTEYENIYKTNILLSEPLRSVGDVKDRLFRDVDGLWKVERNVGELVVKGSDLESISIGAENNVITTKLIDNLGKDYSVPFQSSHYKKMTSPPGTWQNISNIGTGTVTTNSRMWLSVNKQTIDTVAKARTWFDEEFSKGTPVVVNYQLVVPAIETLPQADQDKLNNIASYKDSNYLYTIVDKTNTLPSYVRDNLNPTLHATFKGGGWYSRFKTEQGFNQTNKSVDSLKNETIPALKDGLLNSSEKEAVRQSLNVVSADKKGIDTQYTTVYANKALTGTAKTNLNSAKVALNTAFTNLQNAINAVLGVGEGTRITTAQMTLVTTRLNEYGTALSTYNQRYEQAQDAISSAKEKASKDYALAQANLAETQAKAHADGKVTAEEKRAIADAKAKLDEAKKYVDALEVGGRNYAKGTSKEFAYVTVGKYSGSLELGEVTSQYSYTLEELGAKTGDTMTVSMYVGESTGGYGGGFRIDNQAGQTRYGTGKIAKNGYVSETFTLLADTTEIRLYTAGYGSSGASGSFELPIKELKLEKGNKATDWTPAPEDVQDQLDDKASNESVNEVASGIGEIQNDLIENYAGKGDIERLDEALIASNKAIEEARADSIKDIGAIDNRTAILEQNFGDYAIDWNFIRTSVRLADEGMRISKAGEKTGLLIQNDKISFVSDDNEVAYISGQELYITQGTFLDNVKIGQHRVSTLPSDKTITVIRYEG